MKYREQSTPGIERCRGRQEETMDKALSGTRRGICLGLKECPRKSCEISLDKEEGGQSIKGLSYSG